MKRHKINIKDIVDATNLDNINDFLDGIKYDKVIDAVIAKFSDMVSLHKQRDFLLIACNYLAKEGVYVEVNSLHTFIILCERWLYIEDVAVSAAYFNGCYLGYSDSFKKPRNAYRERFYSFFADACAKIDYDDYVEDEYYEVLFQNSSCVRLECQANKGMSYYYAMSFQDWKQLKQQ